MKMVNAAAIVATILVLVVGPSCVSFGGWGGSGNTIDFGSRRLTTNTWGASPGEPLDCGVFLNRDKTFGWYWDRLDPQLKPGDKFIRPIYPNVRIGASPLERSNARQFPIKVGDIKSLAFDVSYEYLALPTGAYNLAYEMFLSDTKKSGPNLAPKAEVMIWIHRTFTQPADSYEGDFTDGNNSYLLYSWVTSEGRLYASFIMKGEPQYQGQHIVDAKALLDQLDLEPTWYVLGVQFGSEIVNGSGRIQINKLNINVNGHKL